MNASTLPPSKERLLLTALKELQRGYVALLESARDRIMLHGGTCDPLSMMETGDPFLTTARATIKAIEAQSTSHEPPAALNIETVIRIAHECAVEAYRRGRSGEYGFWHEQVNPVNKDYDGKMRALRKYLETCSAQPPPDDYFDKYTDADLIETCDFLAEVMCDYADREKDAKAAMVGTAIDFITHVRPRLKRPTSTKEGNTP